MSGMLIDSETLDTLVFDSVRAEDYKRPATVSAHPTVDRKTITDNAEYSPIEVEVTARIVAEPISTDRDFQIAESGEKRLNEALERFENFLGIRVQWFSPRYGPTKQGVIGDTSKGLVKESHVDLSFTVHLIDVATQRTVELPPERVPKPSSKPEVDAGEQSTDSAEIEEGEGELTGKAAQSLRGLRDAGFTPLASGN